MAASRGRPRTQRPPYVDVGPHVLGAQVAFLRAAAALTEWPYDREAVAFALLQGALGLHRIAQADPEGEALARVEGVLQRVGAERELTRARTDLVTLLATRAVGWAHA